MKPDKKDIPKLHVIFRACDKVGAYNKEPRPFDLNKFDLACYSFHSLIISLRYAQMLSDTHITVIADNSSDKLVAFFERYHNQIAMNIDRMSEGNEGSLKRSFEIADQAHRHQVLYFCEDDYIHQPQAIDAALEALLSENSYLDISRKKTQKFIYSWYYSKLKKKPLVIHLPDYPDRYLPEFTRRVFIFRTENYTWRQISNTTYSILMKSSTFKKYRRVLFKSIPGANDNYLSRTMYGRRLFINQALCLSPLPGLASHMHQSTMTPGVDWQQSIEQIKKDMES